ncbi:GTPase-associated system all-helical protein GASH [Pectobacterium punjabense]|uniref:GTPase-associated system all-helical protein GASH n=1 Tax=Pectobacterium punjabense TaxID=2108399 RepID=UPI003D9BFDFD
MNNIAVHMRICSLTVSDSDVESRQAAAKSLATSWGKDKVTASIVTTSADIAKALGGDGIPSAVLGEKVQIVIQVKSPSYLYEERPQDVGVCAGMAMISILETPYTQNGWSTSDVYATALWLALSYQPVLKEERRENLRREVLTAARDRSSIAADKARARAEVPDPSQVEISINDEKELTHNVNSAMLNTIEALRRNAVLDREELDFLWWAQLGRSRLLDKQWSAINEPTRIITAGIEGARLLRRLPCEVHREIILRTLEQDQKLGLSELLEEIGGNRAELSTAFIKSNITSHPTVFPLLHALTTGETDSFGGELKRSVSEWGERALLEATFARLMSQGAGKI